MEFNQLKIAVKEIEFDTVRTDSQDYFEAVIVKNRLAELVFKLETIFGASVWAPEVQLPKQVQGVIDNFGGIHKGQALYFRLQDKSVTFAMLWPWQDGYHITLKIAQGSFVS